MATPGRPLRPIPWWWALVSAAVVGLAIWISTEWPLAQTHGLQGTDEATARMDAIKTGLSVGVGTGGAVALLLALRRQWLGERDQAHREEVDQKAQAHSDRVATAAEHDAVERRVTDLYVSAANQLGSDKAPVRLAGLYALERLAQNNPAHRTTIVDVICAYLRMPYTPPDQQPDTPGPDEPARAESRRQELQVRRTAQDILVAHVRDDTYRTGVGGTGSPTATFWPDFALDLTGA